MVEEILDLKPVTMLDTSLEDLKLIFKKLYEYSGYDLELVKNVDKRFFTDPASTKYHNSKKHGLFYHSVNVTILSIKYLAELRNNKTDKYLNNLTEEQFVEYLKDLIIASLFHDYAKVGCYIDEENLTDKQIWKIEQECDRLKLNKDDFINKLGKSSGSEVIDALIKNDVVKANSINREYKFNDEFNVGHGEKSVIQLSRLGFKLTDHQCIAIRYHMMAMDEEWLLPKKQGLMLEHNKKVPMLKVLYLADIFTSSMYEENRC